MAVPRPVLLVLLGLALCGAAFLATRGAREPGGAVTAVPAPTPAAPAAHPAKAAKAHAQHRAQPAPHAHATKAARYGATAQSAADRAARQAGAAPATPQQRQHAATKPNTAGTNAARQPGAAQPGAAVAERVKTALARGKVVVFFFTRPGAADDTATRQAVASLRGDRRVLVVRAGLEDLTTYSPVLSGAGVTQVPSVVVVHARQQAHLLEGYVDPGTLRQTVADALR